jgi:hypothetical protein
MSNRIDKKYENIVKIIDFGLIKQTWKSQIEHSSNAAPEVFFMDDKKNKIAFIFDNVFIVGTMRLQFIFDTAGQSIIHKDFYSSSETAKLSDDSTKKELKPSPFVQKVF